jgi:hypothetical protein
MVIAMTWELSEKERISVLAADSRHRYEYFIHRVCETKAVWALYNEGWASVGQDTGESLIPLWPHEAYAEAFAKTGWVGFTPRRIALDDFLKAWIPGMRKEGIQPAIFPVPDGNSAVLPLDDLDAHLRQELAEVYGVEEE